MLLPQCGPLNEDDDMAGYRLHLLANLGRTPYAPSCGWLADYADIQYLLNILRLKVSALLDLARPNRFTGCYEGGYLDLLAVLALIGNYGKSVGIRHCALSRDLKLSRVVAVINDWHVVVRLAIKRIHNLHFERSGLGSRANCENG